MYRYRFALKTGLRNVPISVRFKNWFNECIDIGSFFYRTDILMFQLNQTWK
jgi:hypothetical protein